MSKTAGLLAEWCLQHLSWPFPDDLPFDLNDHPGGAAAGVFAAEGQRFQYASIKQTEQFLDANTKTRDAQWSDDQYKVAWAAGLWVRTFNAKKELFHADNPRYSGRHSSVLYSRTR